MRSGERASSPGAEGLGPIEAVGGDQGGAGVGGSLGTPKPEARSMLGAHFDDGGALHISVRSRVAERIEAWLYAPIPW